MDQAVALGADIDECAEQLDFGHRALELLTYLQLGEGAARCRVNGPIH